MFEIYHRNKAYPRVYEASPSIETITFSTKNLSILSMGAYQCWDFRTIYVIGLSQQPARLHRLAESIPGLLKGLKISSLDKGVIHFLNYLIIEQTTVKWRTFSVGVSRAHTLYKFNNLMHMFLWYNCQAMIFHYLEVGVLPNMLFPGLFIASNLKIILETLTII